MMAMSKANGVELPPQQRKIKRYWVPKCYVCGRRFLTIVNPNLQNITCCRPEHKQFVIMIFGDSNGSSINHKTTA